MRIISEEEWKDLFVDVLTKKMQEADITQRELAERANLHEVTISRYIHKQCMPSIPAIVNISHVLGCSVSELAMFGAKVF